LREDFALRIYSQFNQDGVLLALLATIGTTNKYFVEFGFNAVSYSVKQSGPNSAILRLLGWQGLLIDIANERPAINLRKHLITPENIGPFFSESGVPKELDFLSVDMDSHDILVLEGILKGGYRPRIIQIEVSVFLTPTSRRYLKAGFSPKWYLTDTTRVCYYFGQGLGAAYLLANDWGYSFVAFDFDAFFVRNDILLAQGFDLNAMLLPRDVSPTNQLPHTDGACLDELTDGRWAEYVSKNATLMEVLERTRSPRLFAF